MRWFIILFLTIVVTAWGQTPSPYRSDAEFVILREGVGGTIAALPITREILVIRHNHGATRIYTKERMRSGAYQYRSASGELETLESQLKQLGLFELPQLGDSEYDDIYRQAIGLQVVCADKSWNHSPPVGCIRSQSNIKVSPAQQAIFLRAVERVRSCPPEHSQPCSAEAYEQARLSLFASP